MVSSTRMLVIRNRTMRFAQTMGTSVGRQDTQDRPARKRWCSRSAAAAGARGDTAERERGEDRDGRRQRERPAEAQFLTEHASGERSGQHRRGIEETLGGVRPAEEVG